MPDFIDKIFWRSLEDCGIVGWVRTIALVHALFSLFSLLVKTNLGQIERDIVAKFPLSVY